MSRSSGPDTGAPGIEGPRSGLDPRLWPLWRLSGPVRGYLGAVESLAVVAVAATAWLEPITAKAWWWLALVLFAEVTHLEAARGIERVRELGAEGRPHMHLQTIWIFAAVLLLPPPLVAVVIAVSYGHSWARVYRRRSVLHRKVFSAATVVLACTAAGAVLAAGTGGQAPFMPRLDGPGGLATLVLAGLCYFTVNYVLVVAMIIVTNPDRPGRTALGYPSDVLVVVAAVGLGCGIALMVTVRPWLLPVFAGTPLALQLGLLLPQFRAAARTDGKTSLLDASFWAEVAGRELHRAARLGSTAGVLIIDLDHFKGIDDGYGHPAGDAVLRAVAHAIRGQVRKGDFVGRFGGDEFAVLLPGVIDAELAAIAERVRTGIHRLVVDVPVARQGRPEAVSGLTASLGGAVYPDAGADLPTLLTAADDAAYQAKAAGRDTFVLARRPPPAPVREYSTVTPVAGEHAGNRVR